MSCSMWLTCFILQCRRQLPHSGVGSRDCVPAPRAEVCAAMCATCDVAGARQCRSPAAMTASQPGTKGRPVLDGVLDGMSVLRSFPHQCNGNGSTPRSPVGGLNCRRWRSSAGQRPVSQVTSHHGTTASCLALAVGRNKYM